MAQHNLTTVMGFEIARTLSKRRFWLVTLAVPVLLIVVFLLIFLSDTSTSQSASQQKDARFSFEYTDASGLVASDVVTALHGTRAASPDAGIQAVRSGKVDAYFDFPAHPATQKTLVYGVDSGIFDNGRYPSVAAAILQRSAEARVDSTSLSTLIQGRAPTTTTTYHDGKVTAGFGGVVGGLIYLAVFYVIILLLGNQMLSSTLEEKENRVTEMILTTINPTSLLVGKVISLFVVGVVQMLVFALPIAIGYVFFRSTLNIPDLNLANLQLNPQTMIVGFLLLLGGFALFTGSLVALGAVMPTAKDAGPIFGAMMALIFVPFYTIALIISDPNALIVQVFSYFPFSAPVTDMLRNAFGTLPLGNAIIVIVELFVLAAIVLRLAVQLFRYGSIEYSRKVSIRGVLSRRRAAPAALAAPPAERERA